MFWDEISPQEAELRQRAMDWAIDELVAIQQRQRQEPSFDGGPASRVVIHNSEEGHGADTQLRLVSTLVRQIEEHAPASTRNDDRAVSLDRIIEHRLSAETIARQVRRHAERAGTEMPATAELKAYAARSVSTGTLAQQLFTLHTTASRRPQAGLPYTLALSMAAADPLQSADVLHYLLAVRVRLA